MLAVEPAVERLAALIRIPTVSAQPDPSAFDELLDTMATQWPRLHELEVTRIRSHGLLVRWPGRAADRPVVLMAHLDVVPVVAEDWARDPFSGDIDDGAIHGRGTLDDKGCVAAICEAVEGLLADGFVPAQDVWLSFGCDEEVFGGAAAEAVETLRERGVSPWFVLDEGGAVAAEAFPGITAPLAVIGVAEKGVTSLRLTATGAGGHASTPSRNGPVARLARAITRIEESGMSPRLLPTTAELFRRLAPHAPAPLRPLVANAARLAPAATRLLTHAGPEAAALVRTTFAVTTLSGSPALNVIAASASAGVNVRILPGDTVADVVAHVRKVVKDDDIAVEVVESGEASPVSPIDDAFALIERTTTELFPDAVPTPYVMLAATDSRHFTAICERVYRFAPFRMSRAQRARIHAADEYLMIEDYLDGVRWYRRLVEGL
ncbi:M20/M25/M40 family metallo-hydrolase [Nocardioides sp.]|uniref:M20/M25/M40 family metallo-hydrolase n=1 Tax=Nocardioides sp. TaxID=35761 RepID=UPI0039E50129